MKRLLTKEQHEYFASIIKGRPIRECMEMLNSKYNLELTIKQIWMYKKNHKMYNGLDGHFRKGQQPHNKGKKPPEEVLAKMARTWFPKGVMPHNHKPVGSERINVDGYIEVKIREPRTWMLKQRLVWEEHYGKIPKGKLISFVDGNPLNCSIDNLVMIDRQMNAVLNHKIRIKERPRELLAVVSDIVQIRNKLKELRKRNENNE